jgi:hypothetical protein
MQHASELPSEHTLTTMSVGEIDILAGWAKA